MMSPFLKLMNLQLPVKLASTLLLLDSFRII